jgi:hypothetical protein
MMLASCATQYTQPTSGPLARIKFVTTGGYAYLDEGNSCSTRQFVVEKDWMNVRAEKTIWIEQGFDTSGLPFGMYCGLALSFQPEAGASYVSEYALSGGRCRMTIFRINPSGNRERVQSSKNEAPKTCLI